MTTGRPREFDTKEALENAMQLFWEKGFEATSKRDLMEATGVASQSLYNAFGDKRQLFDAALRHYADTRMSVVYELLSAPRALEGVRELVRMWADVAEDSELQKGCFFCSSLSERGPVDPEAAAFLQDQMARIHAAFVDALRRAKEQGDLAPESDPNAIAATLMCTSNGIMTMRRAGAPEKLLREAVQGALTLLDSA